MAISVGRVMTCVLGMIVKREREIRAFEEVPFYRVLADFKCTDDFNIEAEWKVNENSKYYNSPLLYKDNGFKKEETAKELIKALEETGNIGTVSSIQRKQEKKNPPLLYNLAELQNDCSKLFKISPDETLKVVQELYEKKCVTYPRTDARVLSSAIAKEIDKNLRGVGNHPMFKEYTNEIFESGSYKNIGKTKYTNDKLITDHYAIIPTGQGLNNLNSMPPLNVKVYEVIVRRFLSIFYPPALYSKVALTSIMPIKEEEEKKYTETFNANFKVLSDKGYLKVMEYSFIKDKGDEKNDSNADMAIIEKLKKLKKNDNLECLKMSIKEGKTSPPKRYNSGALILAMENAGQLIEDEELREQIKGSGIGTSATRAEIIKKLVTIKYLNLNKKTQIITPTQLGEMIYEVVDCSIKYLLNPELTASWEKGLTYVAEGSISSEEYMEKLEGYVTRRTNAVKAANNQYQMRQRFEEVSKYY